MGAMGSRDQIEAAQKIQAIHRGNSSRTQLKKELSVNGMHNFLNPKPKSFWSFLFGGGKKKKKSQIKFTVDEKGRVMSPGI